MSSVNGNFTGTTASEEYKLKAGLAQMLKGIYAHTPLSFSANSFLGGVIMEYGLFVSKNLPRLWRIPLNDFTYQC